MKALCPECQLIYSNADQDAAKQQQQAEAAITNGAKVLVLDAVIPVGNAALAIQIVAAVVFAAAALLAASIAHAQLKIAYSDWPGWVMWEIAREKGFFEAEGLPPRHVITMGVATILHWDRFNHDHPVFFAWVLIYAVAPFLVSGLWLYNGGWRPGPVEPPDLEVTAVEPSAVMRALPRRRRAPATSSRSGATRRAVARRPPRRWRRAPGRAARRR